MSRNLYSIEFQEQALIKVRDRGTRSVLDVAADLHMCWCRRRFEPSAGFAVSQLEGAEIQS